MNKKSSFRDRWGTTIIVSVIELMVLPFIAGLYIGLRNSQEMGLMRCWWLAFSQKGVVFMLMLTFSMAVILTIITWVKTDYLEHDEKDRRISEVAIYGDAHVMTDDEVRAYFTVGDESHANRMLYGALDKENREVVSERVFGKGEKTTNFNWALIASAGSGKTSTVLKPMINSLILRGENGLISDTKGELYRDCERYALRYGYKVFCFSPHKEYMRNSDSFNPMDFLDQNLNKVLSFATFILEMDEDAKAEMFYQNGELSLFVALCMMFTNPDYKATRPDCGNITYMSQYLTRTEMGRILTDLGTISEKTPGYDAARAYIDLKDQQKADFKQGLQLKLQKYNSEDVLALTGSTDFEPLDFFGSKTLIFLVVSDNDPTFMPLTRCFFSFFMNALIELSDKVTEDPARGIKQGCMFPAFNIILEETSNIGKIQNLNRIISTVRGRNMNTVLTFQNMQQIATTYKGEEHSLLSACHTQLYFGVNDLFTAEYVSKLMGEKTVETEGTSESGNGNQQRYQDARTLVMQPAEIMEKTFQKQIVKIAGKQPMLLWPITFMKNPKYKELYQPAPDSSMKDRLKVTLRNDKYYKKYDLPKPDEEVRLQRKREIMKFLEPKDLIEYYEKTLETSIVEKKPIIVASEKKVKEERQAQQEPDKIKVAKPKTHRHDENGSTSDIKKGDTDKEKSDEKKKGETKRIELPTTPTAPPENTPKPKKESEPPDIIDILGSSEDTPPEPEVKEKPTEENKDKKAEPKDTSPKKQTRTIKDNIDDSLATYLGIGTEDNTEGE